MRKNYIDNLRWICILLLFPYHTCRIFSTNDMFYIHGGDSSIMTTFVYVCIPWFMPLLFTIAGMSTRYALNKRSISQYAVERVKKLLIPFIAGIVLIIPIQTYYANKFYNGFNGSIIDQYKIFFTKITDLSGYDGGMTPGHLWFILYLFVISMLALIPICLIKKKGLNASKFNIVTTFLLGMIVVAMNFVGNIGGKSIGKYLTLFILGFYVLSDDRILDKIKRSIIILAVLWFIFNTIYVIFNVKYSKNSIPLEIITGWTAILALLGIGQRFLDFSNSFTKYLSVSSFPIYIFHQSILVTVGFYMLQLEMGNGTKALVICLSTIVCTYVVYEVVRRVPVVRLLFGIKGA